MARLVSVKFRGEDFDVEVHHDGGYESDTHAHVIDWSFYGLDAAAHDALNLTDDEEQSISDQLREWSWDNQARLDDDVI